MRRRLLAIVLSLTLLIGLLPTAALASGGDGASHYSAGQTEGETVPASEFTIYKDGVNAGAPSEDVAAGQLSETAPDLSAQNLYFDHAEVNGKRVYEAGSLQDGSDTVIYYGSITGALSILGEDETIGLYYVSEYPVKYQVTDATLTASDDLVKKGESLTFRAKPSAQDMRLVVTANGQPVAGTVYDDATGEMIFTVENVQKTQNVVIRQETVSSYTLSYNREDDAFRNGSITGVSSESIVSGGRVTIQMKSSYKLVPITHYALNMLVINGHEVATPPSNAREGTSVTSTLPSGEQVEVTLTKENGLLDYANYYTVTISNVHSDLYISEGNFKDEDRKEIILKELTGVKDIVGWDFDSEKYLPGSVNMVYLQTGEWGNEFHFNLLSGYQNPELIVKTNGQQASQTIEILASSEPGYQYSFNIPDNLGDNVEIYLSAEPIVYQVEYRNDKNEDDLIDGPESGFTVVEGNHDTITITSKTPYETVAGFTADGYVVKNGNGTVYRSGETVKMADVAPYAVGNTITLVPNWVEVDEQEEREITINLYIEDPTVEDPGTYLLVDSYKVTVGQGKALLRPNDERGREHLREYMDGPSAPTWKDTYNISDFALKYGEDAVHVVEADEDSLDFHYDVNKGTLTVKFAWGTGETPVEGVLPADYTKKVSVYQKYSVDIKEMIPKGYVASVSTVSGTMVKDGVEKTVYLYEDANSDGKPDKHTITLTFSAGEDGTISTTDPSGSLSEDQKTLTYTLVKAIPNELTGDKYPSTIPNVTVSAEGQGWLGWFNTAATDDRYASYAGTDVPADAEDITFEARYDAKDGYKLVTINYYLEQEGGGFGDDPYYTISKYARVDEKVIYTRKTAPSDTYVTPNEGVNGEILVSADGDNTVNLYYYFDKDKNNKPDDYTLTLSFTGTGHGSWDKSDPMWGNMTEGEDYTFVAATPDAPAHIKVYLVKTNDVGFPADTYPTAPKVTPEKNWLFDSWQDENERIYGKDDGITIGDTVGASDADRSYQTVYDEDKNNDKIPDDEQSVTVTFQPGDHGTIAGQAEFNLVPGINDYPSPPTVTAKKGFQFVGWTPAYNKSGTVEANAERNQTYTATYKAEHTLIYEGNPQGGGTVSNLPANQTVLEGATVGLDTTQKPEHSTVDNTTVLFIGWCEQQTNKIYGKEDKDEFADVTLTTRVTIGTEDKRVYAVWGYDSDGDNKPDVQEPTETPNLTEIVAPSAITGVANGTALADIRLPEQVTIHTTEGDMQAQVSWDTSSVSYDPSKEEAQTFTLNGTVTLPQGVTNTNSIPLTTTISITVDAKVTVSPYALTYDANGGKGGPGRVEVQPDQATDYVLDVANVPKHAPDADDGTMIIFIGWT